MQDGPRNSENKTLIIEKIKPIFNYSKDPEKRNKTKQNINQYKKIINLINVKNNKSNKKMKRMNILNKRSKIIKK